MSKFNRQATVSKFTTRPEIRKTISTTFDISTVKISQEANKANLKDTVKQIIQQMKDEKHKADGTHQMKK